LPFLFFKQNLSNFAFIRVFLENINFTLEYGIRTTASVVTQRLRLETPVRKRRFFVSISRKLRKRVIRNLLLISNVTIFLAVFAFFIHNSTASQAIVLDTSNPTQSATLSDPLDQLSSSEIAAQVAGMTGITEKTAVTNLSESENANLNITPADNQILSKPQVLATAIKSREDIVHYIVQSGDTISSLAVKFGVTSNSIIWSNGLTSYSSLSAGESLYIPPVNGVVYIVKSGDTATSLAQSYKSNSAQITSFNDDEISGLVKGQRIVIPNGQIQVAAPTSYYTFDAEYDGNGYDFGYCTWFVATQIAVPSNWGNASSWAYYAALSGWTVRSTPTVGAIAQTPYVDYGQGHVAIVTAVSADGSQIEFKDMNNYGDGGGWDRIGYSTWQPTSLFPNYITH